MEPLKNVYNEEFISTLGKLIRSVVPKFDTDSFITAIHEPGWQQMELKQRMRHISVVHRRLLPGDYRHQLEIICEIVSRLQKQKPQSNSFAWICLPDFPEVYGLEDFDASLDAMELITSFISCEFAVRPYLLANPEKVMKRMVRWSRHSDHHVRRFSSEGCRPRLPWGKAIPAFKKDPSPILPVLENLKNDPSEFVRKSVANNINDIAKDHPGIVLKIVKSWKGKSKETDWILRHGCRTLLRNADPLIYKQFGLSAEHVCDVRTLRGDKKEVMAGESINIGFALVNKAKTSQLLRVELGVHYVKANGSTSRKLFKITENTFHPATVYQFKRKIDFSDLTTRKHYAGKHKITVVINGKEMSATTVNLLPA